MRDAIRGLTLRGRAVALSGLVIACVAWALGQRDLMRAAALALLLPLVCAGLVARTRFRLTSARGLAERRIELGSTTMSLVRVTNSSRLPSGTLLVTDEVPALLGTSQRAVMQRLAPGEARDVGTALTGSARGRYEVGPVSLTLRDPFGMCEVQRAFRTTDTLIVTPRTITLPPNGMAGLWGGRGDSEARSIAHTGDDDVIPREYRIGDELRRVHWRATARTGELMVRREEQPWHTTATIVLDRRAPTHRGRFPDTTFELAVSVAASAAVHLTRLGLRVRVLDTAGAPVTVAEAEVDAEGALLDSLAVVQPSAGAPLSDSAALRRSVADGTVLAVVCHLSPADTAVLGALRRSGGVAAALIIDAGQWDTDAATLGSAAQASAALSGRGWRCATISPDRAISDPAARLLDTDRRVTEAWSSLAAGSVVGARA